MTAKRPNIINRYVAARVRQLRLEQGQTQDEAAHLANIPQHTWSALENDRSTMTIDYVFRLTHALGVEFEDVLPEVLFKRGQPIEERELHAQVREELRCSTTATLTLDDIFAAIERVFGVSKREAARKPYRSRKNPAIDRRALARGIAAILAPTLLPFLGKSELADYLKCTKTNLYVLRTDAEAKVAKNKRLAGKVERVRKIFGSPTPATYHQLVEALREVFDLDEALLWESYRRPHPRARERAIAIGAACNSIKSVPGLSREGLRRHLGCTTNALLQGRLIFNEAAKLRPDLEGQVERVRDILRPPPARYFDQLFETISRVFGISKEDALTMTRFGPVATEAERRRRIARGAAAALAAELPNLRQIDIAAELRTKPESLYSARHYFAEQIEDDPKLAKKFDRLKEMVTGREIEDE